MGTYDVTLGYTDTVNSDYTGYYYFPVSDYQGNFVTICASYNKYSSGLNGQPYCLVYDYSSSSGNLTLVLNQIMASCKMSYPTLSIANSAEAVLCFNDLDSSSYSCQGFEPDTMTTTSLLTSVVDNTVASTSVSNWQSTGNQSFLTCYADYPSTLNNMYCALTEVNATDTGCSTNTSECTCTISTPSAPTAAPTDVSDDFLLMMTVTVSSPLYLYR